MKHFITAISLAKDLKTTVYKNAESVEFLETDREFSHPILVPIQNLAESGEKIKVTVILTSKTSPFVKQNYEHFVGELNRLRDEIGFDYGEINLIEASYDESSSKHLKLFESIINSIGSDELITADVTYGNKPTSMALQLALTYSYLYGDNTAVKALVYGEYNHDIQLFIYFRCFCAVLYQQYYGQAFLRKAQGSPCIHQTASEPRRGRR